MNEILISFETAVLAKEKGFDKWCSHGFLTKKIVGSYLDSGCSHDKFKYGGEGSDEFILWKAEHFPQLYEPWYKAPTQSLLQKWLRDVHNIHIDVSPESDHELITITPYVYSYYVHKDKEVYVNTKFYDNYEEGLEDALKRALNLIK